MVRLSSLLMVISQAQLEPRECVPGNPIDSRNPIQAVTIEPFSSHPGRFGKRHDKIQSCSFPHRPISSHAIHRQQSAKSNLRVTKLRKGFPFQGPKLVFFCTSYFAFDMTGTRLPGCWQNTGITDHRTTPH
ncbi:hypothetical protein B0T13DRAFT_21115 [Neurospora crassa]|nr:hypothetical protein B0T13DRAFT_21115 [Neurospora crassa]